MEKRLYRDEQHKMIGGVCAGLADYFNIDVTIIRILFFATLILKGGGLLLYIILWICLPKKSTIFTDPTVDYTVPPNPFGNVPPQNPGGPFVPPVPRHKSNGSVIAGAILIIIGSFCLIDEFNIIPDIDFENLWPVILVLVGIVLIFSRTKKQPWENANWHQTDKKEETPENNDNPPTL
jgi:phage shock protein C